MRTPQIHFTDILVIGAGLAGMQVALHVGDGLGVTLVDGGVIGESGASPHAKGGVAVAVGEGDSPAFHAADTEVAGAGFCDADIVKLVCDAGPARLAELLQAGVPFDRAEDERLVLNHEAAHSHRRVVRAGGDRSGRLICATLARRIRESATIELRQGCTVVELISQAQRVLGACLQHRDGRREVVMARATVLATGGLGQLYARSSNPAEACGTGLTLAMRAGAKLVDLEFVQFHPTGLWAGTQAMGAPVALLSEAIRGEGAHLVDEQGRRFMCAIHPDAELAPRDIVSRGIWEQQARGESVYLDATALGESFARRFPSAFEDCQRAGFNPATDRLPVSPVAHYHMGGVKVDADGRTSVKGLWACGEVASTGLHGANRLASNSLLEALVFGERVARSVSEAVKNRLVPLQMGADLDLTQWPDTPDCADAARALQQVRALMWATVGVVRNGADLERTLEQLDLMAARFPARSAIHDTITLASLIALAALRRCESRGGHYRSDFPQSSPDWQKHTIFDASGICSESVPRAVAISAR